MSNLGPGFSLESQLDCDLSTYYNLQGVFQNFSIGLKVSNLIIMFPDTTDKQDLESKGESISSKRS
jgi:hypothetical protein